MANHAQQPQELPPDSVDDTFRVDDGNDVDTAPARSSQLGRRAWWGVLRRTGRQFLADNLTDWAAALTYYGILSLFPGLVVVIAAVSLFGQPVTEALVDNLTAIAPGPARDILTQSIDGLQQARGSAGVLAVVGLAGALWAASGYVGAFMRASNAIYDVPEGRPIWKILPIRLALTVAVGVLLVASMMIVVLSGRLARLVGDLIDAGDTARTAWEIAKWPVLVILVCLMLALLYWAAPNARQAGFRWITPGGLIAVVIWILASVGFGFYAANFGSYNKTYGTLGGVIIFLIWLWITNLAILFGAEFDAELHRARSIAAGHPEDAEPYVPLRDTRKIDQDDSGDKGLS